MSKPYQTIQFVAPSVPPITPGKYTLTVKQEIHELDDAGEIKDNGASQSYATRPRTVHVQGERFSIDPRDIHSVFPPEGGVGDYGNENALPHITFYRKSLPWEQSSGVVGVPWLALLVFHESDEGGIPTITPAMVGDLSRDKFRPGESPSLGKRDSTLTTAEPGGTRVIATYADMVQPKLWETRPGENAWDACLVVDIPVRLFQQIAPTKDDLAWLAHSRIASGPEETQAFSAVIANRAPLRKGTSTACLVSLEQIAAFLPPAPTIAVKRRNATHVRLVVMKAWSFRCDADLHGFHHKLPTGPLKVPYTKPDAETPEDIQVKNALSMGYTALDHNTRWGDQAISWYRGPFLPFSSEITRTIPLPPICDDGYVTGTTPLSSADEALRYDPELGMLDVSYAAAWQLGRLIALRDETFARDLYHWKRENKRKIIEPRAADVFAFMAEIMQSVARSLNLAQAARDLINDPDRLKAHLRGTRAPESVVSRLDKLRRLEGVPLDYLVPDERMLPAESLRFFQVDLNWVYSLIEGAYSIARVSTGDRQQDAATCPHDVYHQVSGFLLRSKIVSDWPNLQAQVEISDPSAKFKTLRCERITPDILLCLVEVEGHGIITSATLQVPRENIEFHFPESAQFRDAGKSVVQIASLAAEERSVAEFAVSLAFEPILTPNFVVDRTVVYPGEKVRLHCDNAQADVWYAISVSSAGGPLPPPPGFFKTGPTIGYETAPILTNSVIEVFAEFPLNGRRKLLRKFSITVSRTISPDDSLEVVLVNTMSGELLPNEFYLGRTPLIRVGRSQEGVTYQLLADGIPVGSPVRGRDSQHPDGLELNAIELRQDTTYSVRASRSDDPRVLVDLKQSVKVIAVPDIALDAKAVKTTLPRGSETKVLVANSQLGVHYTLESWPFKGDETQRKMVAFSSVRGTGKPVELPTGPIWESSYFRVTAKLPGSRVMDLRQKVLISVENSPSG